MNVSLSTFHETHEDYARVVEHQADYFFRRELPLLQRVVGYNRALAPMKRLMYRVASRAGMAEGRPVKQYFARYRIDPEAPTGVRELTDGPVLTEHSRIAQDLGKQKAA